MSKEKELQEKIDETQSLMKQLATSVAALEYDRKQVWAETFHQAMRNQEKAEKAATEANIAVKAFDEMFGPKDE